MTNLVLLSYADEKEHKRTVLAIQSFFAWFSGPKEDIRVVLFTDNHAYFKLYLTDILVEYHLITPLEWLEMLKGSDFKFFRKIAVIEEYFNSYPLDNMLFLDSDTFFISDPALLIRKIEPGTSVMHLLDFTFAEGYPFATPEQNSRFITWLEAKSFSITGHPTQFGKDNVSWNSGVIGVTGTMANLIPDVYQLTDEIYKATSFHVSEQLAFALVLQTTTKVCPSDQYVLHYWANKALPISGLSANWISYLTSLSSKEKQELIRWLTLYLKIVFRSTISFNSDKYSNGYKYALQAFKLSLGKERRLINHTHLAKVVVYNTLRFFKIIRTTR